MPPQRVDIDDWPRLTRFYGIPPSELARMPHVLLRLYAEQLIVLASEEALVGFITADLPYASKEERKRVHREYLRYLPDDPKPENALDVRTESGADVAATLGIGVHIEPSEVESSQDA